MSEQLKKLSINKSRFRKDFDELCKIGRTKQTGVNRPVFSQSHLEARKWFRKKTLEAGLEFHIDGAGNHSALLKSHQKDAPALLLGSHLDSVPDGGRYDGALGVLAALEVLRSISDEDIQLPVNLEAIDFTDEEGTIVSFLGSFAFTGKLTQEILNNPRGGRKNLVENLERVSLKESELFSAQREPKALAGYLELHVEQGPYLEKSGQSIGIVEQIAGLSFYRLTFIGREDHAGTISMQERLDAAQGASAFTLAVREIMLNKFPDCKANVGYTKYTPGAFNIVPEKAEISFEFRAADMKTFREMDQTFVKQAKLEAEKYGLELQIEFLGKRDPVQMAAAPLDAIHEAVDTLGLSYKKIISWAGHDAQALADICPSGMIFVPSVGGRSHSPEEFTKWEDCVNGANVLLHAALGMASK
jgi:N-carbamoyl-L-amino-acid hydrolase